MIDYTKDSHQEALDGSNPVKFLDRPSTAQHNHQYAYQSLPPTPSSSTRSINTNIQDYATIDSGAGASATPFSLRLTIPKPYYGSFLSPYPPSPAADSSTAASMMMPSDHSVPSTPPHTTVSSDDDEEGLYLAWTHQLLREQGYRPQSCHGGFDNDADDDSSVSDDDTFDYDKTRSKSSKSSSWLAYLPTCFQ